MRIAAFGPLLINSVPLLVSGLLLALIQTAGLAYEPLLHHLEWSRSAMIEGQWWRLLTGHWIHLGPVHLGLNLAGLLLIGLLFNRPAPPTWFWAYLLVAPLFISAALFWAEPTLDWYRGFSGCLHGLFVLVAFANLRHSPCWTGLTLAALCLKLILEYFYPGDTAGLIGAPVISAAHWFGTLTGLVAGIGLVFTETRLQPSAG